MNTKIFNLVLLVTWSILFVGLLTRSWWMSDELLKKVDSPQTPLLMALAGVFALWNGARLWASTQSTPTARPTMTDRYRQKIKGITGEDPRVTDPQFDFNNPESAPKDETSR